MVKTDNHFGNAFAGHAYRAVGDEKRAAQYDNPLTDFINLMIAECKAKQNRETVDNNRNGADFEPAGEFRDH